MSVLGSDPVRDHVDRMIREALRHPDNLRDFLEDAVPDLAPGFDVSRARLLDREFPLDDWRRRESDLPFEIPYRLSSREVWALVCVLLEHQSDTDPLMPLRLLYFATIYWDKQWHAWEQLPTPRPPFHLHPILPIVLYTGSRPWGSNQSLRELLDEPAAFHAFVPDFRPLFWNLADHSPEQLLQTGREWLQTLAVPRVEEESADTFARVVAEVARLLEPLHGKNHPRWYDLLRIVLTYIAWRRPAEERNQLVNVVQQAQADMLRREEVQKMGQKLGATIVDIARDEGRQEGRLEGRQEGRLEGRQEGRQEGQLLACRAILRGMLEDRFSPLPPDVLQRIESCEDVARLQTAIQQSSRLQKLDDLQL